MPEDIRNERAVSEIETQADSKQRYGYLSNEDILIDRKGINEDTILYYEIS